MASTKEANPNHPVSSSLQDMGDFEREHKAVDAARESEMDNQRTKSINGDPVFDINSIVAEERALNNFSTWNWIGMLHEYRQSHRVGSTLAVEGLSYKETIIGRPPHRFTCTVSIDEAPHPFGGGVSFIKKSNAKRYAAQQAVEWLIENKLMPNDGTVNFPKPPPLQLHQSNSDDSDPSTAAVYISTSPPPTGPSWRAMVPTLCHKLGINIPSYSVTQKIIGQPLWDVCAEFGNGSRISKKVGCVENVFGKTNAKEASAKLIVGFLLDIERQKSEIYEEEDRKLKEESASSGSEYEDDD